MPSILDHLNAAPYDFHFFAAVRVLAAHYRDREPVGGAASPHEEIARFQGYPSLAFPPSQILTIESPADDRTCPILTVTFFGLYGMHGVLPAHYTQLLIPTIADDHELERQTVRDWFDLFNHRFVSLFYRAWEKYRFQIPYERGEYRRGDGDAFTSAVRSLIGLGSAGLSNRLVLRSTTEVDPNSYQWGGRPSNRREERKDPSILAHVDDLALLRYAGLFVQRPRTAGNLQLVIGDYFQLPTQVEQFRGQWLQVPEVDKPVLGVRGKLGQDTVIGDRVWDMQSRFRLILGPLTYPQFIDLLPDRTPVRERKTLFVVSQLARTFVGAEWDFDVQLVLAADQVPMAELSDGSGIGPRLGWNLWLITDTPWAPVTDAVFEGEWVTEV
jgi:type VI secretion system protein ImpH